MSTAPSTRITPEEYLAGQRKAESKSEYLSGYVYAMSGGTREHSLIALNLAAEWRSHLREQNCETHLSDMRVKVSPTGLYTYPDVTLVCGELRFEDSRKDTLLNPTVIAEVLSGSTEAYDRGDKFAHYRRLESLQEYLLISQDRVRVEHFVRQGDHWLLKELSDLNDVLRLSSVECGVSLREIYWRVEVPESGPAGPPVAADS